MRELERAELVAPALFTDRGSSPGIAAPGTEIVNDPAGVMAGQRGEILHFQPQFGDDAGVAHLKAFFQRTADLRAAGACQARKVQPVDIDPGPRKRNDQQQAQQIGEIEPEIPTGNQTADQGHQSHQEDDGTAVSYHIALPGGHLGAGNRHFI